jgi:hypothetical protein
MPISKFRFAFLRQNRNPVIGHVVLNRLAGWDVHDGCIRIDAVQALELTLRITGVRSPRGQADVAKPRDGYGFSGDQRHS